MATYTWTSPVSGDWSTTTDWTPNGLPGASDHVTIAASGAVYTVTVDTAEAAGALTLDASTATLAVNSSLTLAGLLALDAGTLDLNGGGTINGGTLALDGGTFVGNGGTLDGVTCKGALTLAGSGQDLFVENGLTLQSASGASPGSIDLSGATYTAIVVLGSETLDNATLNFGNGSNDLLTPATAAETRRSRAVATRCRWEAASPSA